MSKKRRQSKEQKLLESLTPQKTDYYFSCFNAQNVLQKMKIPDYMAEHFTKQIKLMTVRGYKLFRNGLYVWKEVFLTFTDDLIHKCFGYQNKDTSEVFFKIMRQYQTPLLPNHVAAKLQGCINMIMQRYGRSQLD